MMIRRTVVAVMALGGLSGVGAATELTGEVPDPRLRVVTYRDDAVYRLPGMVGYDVDLQFATAERFIGLGSGDVEALSFSAEGNHLFIKPKAADVHTNLTVLTTLHVYHFEYWTVRGEASASDSALYALRFTYDADKPQGGNLDMPKSAAGTEKAPAAEPSSSAQNAIGPRNYDYWYCGDDSLRPRSAWDDGVQTHMRFSTQNDLPALFVRAADGSESLLNFDISADEVVIHRVAHQFILRRGALQGCVVNKSADKSEHPLPSGTVLPDVQRVMRQPSAESANE